MDTQKQPSIAVHTVGLTFVLFNCVTMMLSAGGSLFGTLAFFEKSAVFYLFMLPGLGAAFVAGTCLMLASHWGIVANASTRRRWALVLAATGGAAFLGMLAAPDSATMFLAVAAGITAALSYLLQFMTWGSRLSHEGFKHALLCIALASALSGACALALFEFASALVMAGSYCVALIAGGTSCIVQLGEDEPDSVADVAPENRRLTLNRELWPLFAGSLLCMFTILLMWQGAEASATRPESASITRGMFMGFVACAAALAIIARMHPSNDALRRGLTTACPLFAALPIVPCIIPINPDPISGTILGMLSGVGFSYFMGAPVAAFCVDSKNGKNAQGVWGMAAVALATGGLFGMISANALDGAQATPLTLSLFVAYLVACAIIPRSSRQNSKADGASSIIPRNASDTALAKTEQNSAMISENGESSKNRDTSINPLNARCDELASQWGLTPRECEVLDLLAQGRSQPSIARELYCSPETVKVHVRHIYEKAGIHSKDALLELVHG